MRKVIRRLFNATSLILIVGYVLLFIGFHYETKSFLLNQKEDELANNASAISNVVEIFDSFEQIDNDWILQVCGYFSYQATGNSVYLFDASGNVVSNITGDSGISISDVLPDYIQTGLKTNQSVFLPSFRTDSDNYCLLLVKAVSSKQTGSFLGYVAIASDDSVIQQQLNSMTLLFVILTLFLCAAALFTAYKFNDRESQEVQKLSNAVYEFGHGNLNVRAKENDFGFDDLNLIADSFNNMADSIQKEELQQREFVANVSHELKTPMTTIAGFMDGMLDGTIPEDQYKKYMQTVSNEVRRLSRLVRSMLEVSRLQDTGIQDNQRQKFDICEVMGRTLLSFEQRINAKNINVDVEIPDNGLLVWAVEDAITQVIYNLIDNAVKFCPTDGDLFLQIESDGQKAYVSVANSGETIPENELPLVFDRFHKTDKSRSQNTEGAGLGLYIVKTIINTHGENITVTSRDSLTRFTFTLPVK